MKPLVFVAMPFGQRMDQSKSTTIDFDFIYQEVIKPAAEKVDVDIIRSDEEIYGGIIHVTMFERLLLSEIVVADLTLGNPNVFYELGIRHAARPYATIPIHYEKSELPFNVAPLRAISYGLASDGRPDSVQAQALRDSLILRLKRAREASESADSPVFQLIDGYPGVKLPPNSTTAFRTRAGSIETLRSSMRQAKSSACLEAARKQLCNMPTISSELWVDLLLSFRDLEAWSEAIDSYELIPDQFRDHQVIQEQLAFALNRRNAAGDRQTAIGILQRAVERWGKNPETCGMLGRVYKDLYKEARLAGNNDRAAAYLDRAIEYYIMGFSSDPRDF